MARVLRERYLDSLMQLAGQRVQLVKTDGSELNGVFHTVSGIQENTFDFVIKAARDGKEVRYLPDVWCGAVCSCSHMYAPVDLRLLHHTLTQTHMCTHRNRAPTTAGMQQW